MKAMNTRIKNSSLTFFFDSPAEANDDFKKMNAGKTFQTGKWVPEKTR
jgi:hypothetical protein